MPKRNHNKQEEERPYYIHTLFEDLMPEETINAVKFREHQFRSNLELHSSIPVTPNFPSLILPPRWEALQAEAKKRRVPLKPLISPVQEAIARVQKELRQIQETGMGRLFVLSGITGSGKTTFIHSLQHFIDGVGVDDIKLMTIDRKETVENALALINRENNKISIIVLEGKEAPGSLKSDEIDVLLTTLNTDFRRDSGRRTLFVIPTTSPVVAQMISERAANIGGMTSRNSPFYVFSGPPRKEYITITNNTLRALNDSRTLLDYGLKEKTAIDLAESAESIGMFMASCYEEIQKQRDKLEHYATSLNRKRFHLWIVFCSMEENSRINDDIIRSLTVGDQQHAQVKRLLIGDSKEARYWETQEGFFGIAADYLDLRIMYLPLRTANTIITAYGHQELLDHLKNLRLESGDRIIKREAVRARAQESLANTAIGAFLKGKGFIDRDPSKRGNLSDKQKELFREIVKIAAKDDKALNAAIAETLRDLINEPEYVIATEVPLNDNGSLITDIGVVTPTDIYCLELKWRSSVLHNSDIIRETMQRVKEFVENLPELKKFLDNSTE